MNHDTPDKPEMVKNEWATRELAETLCDMVEDEMGITPAMSLRGLLTDFEASRDEWKDRAEKAEAAINFTYCAYCGKEFPMDDDASDVSEHIATCPKHPMRDVETRLAEVTAGYEARGKTIDAMTEDIEEMIKSLDEAEARAEKAEVRADRVTTTSAAHYIAELEARLAEAERVIAWYADISRYSKLDPANMSMLQTVLLDAGAKARAYLAEKQP